MVTQDAFSSLDYSQNMFTCVLASYAVAANPFVKVPVLDFFVAYCCEYGLSHQHPERSYDKDFHDPIRHPNGYDVILNLHNNSSVGLFKTCRKAFELQDVRGINLATIEHRLATEQNTSMMLFVNKSNRKQDLGLADCHSIAVGCSQGHKLFYYDTGIGRLVGNFGRLADLGVCGDMFLLVARH